MAAKRKIFVGYIACKFGNIIITCMYRQNYTCEAGTTCILNILRGTPDSQCQGTPSRVSSSVVAPAPPLSWVTAGVAVERSEIMQQ